MKTFWASFWAFFAAGAVLIILALFVLVGLLTSSLMGKMEVDEIDDNSIIKIDLSMAIADKGSSSPVGDLDLGLVKFSQQHALLDVVNAIDVAAVDGRVSGIYLEVPMAMNLSMTAVEDIRNALSRFKSSGKFVVSYSEYYPQNGYYLSSVADSIFVNPLGGVEWYGMSVDVVFVKGLLDKLGVEAQVVRHGTFKSAIEPYTLTKMSEASRKQYSSLLESIWGSVLSDVSRSRGIDSLKLIKYANDLRCEDPQIALDRNMVTGLKYQDQVVRSLADITNVDDDAKFYDLADYISMVETKKNKSSKNKIAVLYAQGTIMDGELKSQDILSSNNIIKELEKLRKDDDVKAVVIRVDSPGGSALAAEVIWREVELLRQKKPVIVSMGDYAASGGYYIACPADIIIANRSTITGSIGVFGVLFNAQQGLKNKLGVTVDGVKTNTSSDVGSVYRPITKAEQRVLQASIERVYDTFVERVAEGRDMSVRQIDQLGQGRVWSGVSASELGLIDGFGGLREAILLAVDRVGIASDFRVVVAGEKDNMTRILESLKGQTRARIFGSSGIDIYNQERIKQQLLKMQGVQALAPRVSFNGNIYDL